MSSTKSFDDLKDEITELYMKNTLPTVQSTLNNKYGFDANNNQWKKKIRQWGLNVKNIKSSSYQVMVRKRKQREEDGSGKQTAFNLHGRNVRIDKVNRFEKALSKRRPEGTGEANHVEAETPPSLQCLSPAMVQDHVGTLSRQRTPIHAEEDSFMTREDIQNKYQTAQTLSDMNGPSLRKFDWWKPFENFSGLIMTTTSSSPNLGFRKLLLDFAIQSNRYEGQMDFEALRSSIEWSSIMWSDCPYCQILTIVSCMERIMWGPPLLGYPKDTIGSLIRLERAARVIWTNAATVWLIEQEKPEINRTSSIWDITISTSSVFILTGKPRQAKRLLEAVILDMNASIHHESVSRKFASLALAECYFELGNFCKANELLSILFGSYYEPLRCATLMFMPKDSALYCYACSKRIMKRICENTIQEKKLCRTKDGAAFVRRTHFFAVRHIDVFESDRNHSVSANNNHASRESDYENNIEEWTSDEDLDSISDEEEYYMKDKTKMVFTWQLKHGPLNYDFLAQAIWLFRKMAPHTSSDVETECPHDHRSTSRELTIASVNRH